MRIKVKKLIEKHIKLIEDENFYQLFANANYMHFDDDDMDELVDLLDNQLGFYTIEYRKELFALIFDESITPFLEGRIGLADHLNGCFDNVLSLTTDEIVDIINNGNKASVDHNYMMEIL